MRTAFVRGQYVSSFAGLNSSCFLLTSLARAHRPGFFASTALRAFARWHRLIADSRPHARGSRFSGRADDPVAAAKWSERSREIGGASPSPAGRWWGSRKVFGSDAEALAECCQKAFWGQSPRSSTRSELAGGLRKPTTPRGPRRLACQSMGEWLVVSASICWVT